MVTRSSATEPRAGENPLLEGLELRRRPEPCVLTIFGASGDLTRRKIFPALYALAYRPLLPEQFAVLGVARTEAADRAVRLLDGGRGSRVRPGRVQRRGVGRSSPPDSLRLDRVRRTRRARTGLPRTLRALDEELGTRRNRVYYLAVPPDAMPRLVEEIGERRSTDGWTRLIVEKPFGHDLESARELNELLAQRHFAEDEVFRIDHYLGQGHRPEPARAALRQRHLRARLEPAVHRPRPDHGRRVDRDREPCRVLRAGRSDPRRVPEPPPPAGCPDRHGAADRLHRRRRAQREAEGAEGARDAGAERGRARAVRAGLHRGRASARLP